MSKNNNKKWYLIDEVMPVLAYQTVEVEAESIEEARELALKMLRNGEGEYITEWDAVGDSDLLVYDNKGSLVYSEEISSKGENND